MKNSLTMKDLIPWMHKFKERFGEPVPTCQILSSNTVEHLIETIKKCLDDNVNYLPQIYGYGSDDQNIIY